MDPLRSAGLVQIGFSFISLQNLFLSLSFLLLSLSPDNEGFLFIYTSESLEKMSNFALAKTRTLGFMLP